MTTKLIINGQVRLRGIGDRRELPTGAYPLDDEQLERQHEALGRGVAQPRQKPMVAALPMKNEGIPWFDAQDRVTYKVSRNLSPALGWGSMGFWMARWKVSSDFVLYLARVNHLDAATEPASAVKRYRCIDETRTLQLIATERKREAAVAAAKQTRPAPKNALVSKKRR